MGIQRADGQKMLFESKSRGILYTVYVGDSTFWAFRMGPAASGRGLDDIDRILFRITKVGCIFFMVVNSVLPLAGFGPSDYRKDAYHFKSHVKKLGIPYTTKLYR